MRMLSAKKYLKSEKIIEVHKYHKFFVFAIFVT